jgi:hypothetical protein
LQVSFDDLGFQAEAPVLGEIEGGLGFRVDRLVATVAVFTWCTKYLLRYFTTHLIVLKGKRHDIIIGQKLHALIVLG